MSWLSNIPDSLTVLYLFWFCTFAGEAVSLDTAFFILCDHYCYGALSKDFLFRSKCVLLELLGFFTLLSVFELCFDCALSYLKKSLYKTSVSEVDELVGFVSLNVLYLRVYSQVLAVSDAFQILQFSEHVVLWRMSEFAFVSGSKLRPSSFVQ